MQTLDSTPWTDELGTASSCQEAICREAITADARTDEPHAAPGGSSQSRVAALLNGRLAASPTCPRCGSTRVQRWGKIDGVQRLRCRGCSRTFNPLTGTPLARLRRRDLWLDHARVLEAGLSLRRGARAIGVHYNTTLRWRHRWLERPREAIARQFTGMVAAAVAIFEPCAHQPRGWTRVALPAHQGAVPLAGEQRVPAAAIPVLLLRDQRGSRGDAVLSWPMAAGLASILDGLVDPASNSLCGDDHPAIRAYCSRRGIAQRVDAAGRREQDAVVACRHRLQSWMCRFAGVSTHRLATYLGWRRLLEASGGRLAPAGWLDRALGSCQHSTVTRGDGSAGLDDGRAGGPSDGWRGRAPDAGPQRNPHGAGQAELATDGSLAGAGGGTTLATAPSEALA